ncbi:MAG TPA: O-antigen ligase family protein [Chloroflexota bacterium]|nr:O-antigen ligase family protein [Chloroflexota bacterium]
MATGTTLRAGPRADVSSALIRDWSAAPLLVAVTAAYYLINNTALSLLLLLALAALIWLRSDLAVTLIPLAVPLWPVPKHLHLVRSLEFSLGETVIVLCAVVVFLQELQRASSRPPGVSLWRHFVPPSPFEWPALAFLLAGVLATLSAQFHTYALREFREVLVEPLLFYWLILQRVHGPAGAARLALAAVGAGVLVALLGLGQLLFRPHDLIVATYIPGTPRLVHAVYGNENNLALLLDRAIPMALALALAPGWLGAFRAWRAGSSIQVPFDHAGEGALAAEAGLPGAGSAIQGDDPLVPYDDRSVAGAITLERAWQLTLVVASALMLFILYRTHSRGGEATVAVCLAVLFAYWQRRRPQVLAGGVVIVALATIALRHQIQDKIINGHGLTTDARFSIWDSGVRMLRDHPYFGVGPDNFLYYYSNDSSCAPGHIANWYYQQQNAQGVPVNFERCVSHPHNLFLDLWLSTGFLGLLAGLALLVLFVLVGLRALRHADTRWRGPILAALIAMLAFVVHGQVDNSYFLPDLSVLFWLCLGIVALWDQHVLATG